MESLEPMRVLRGWRTGMSAIAGGVTAAHEDREVLIGPSALLMVSMWALAGRHFCFRAANGIFYIGLFEAPPRKRRRRARR